jgi:hypothetical protein
MNSETNFPIQTYTVGELAALYRCSVKTFVKWLKRYEDELGPRFGRFYTPRQVALIVLRLGPPRSEL